MSWCALAAVGGANVQSYGKHQFASHLQNHLQLHPELNAVLGFTASSKGYALYYHDAAVIHRAKFGWEQPGPLYAFVQKLYARSFQDFSMQIRHPERPTWTTKVDDGIYISRTPRALAGPGQRRYTTVARNSVRDGLVFIKDIWRGDHRLFIEGLLFDQAHEGNPLAGLMLVHSHGYVLDKSQESIRTTHLLSDSADGRASRRYKIRMLTKEIGRPLEQVRSLRQFLCVVYDACAVQRNLYRKCKILHRDISEGNIMLAPDTDEYRRRCAEGYAEVKFMNQVLAKDKGGTPKFIARSVSEGELLGEEEYESRTVDMPPMEGPLADYAPFMHDTEYRILHGRSLPTHSELEFTHRLFHDAESTFWVIAWTLVRSVREGPQPKEKPDRRFCEFFHVMHRHCPIPEDDDSLSNLCSKDEEKWKSVLHPQLSLLAPMLAQMYEYIRPGWAYRPELDVEHVHEALMRLLLTEIVCIDASGQDIPIILGGRAIPPPVGMPPLPRSTRSSLSNNASRSHSFHSMQNLSSSVGGERAEDTGSSKKQSRSQSAEPQTLDLSYAIRTLTMDPGDAAGHEPEESLLPQLGEPERPPEWESGAGELRE
ncbi:unnamed protein product, partial [Rhizoctonia solani]